MTGRSHRRRPLFRGHLFTSHLLRLLPRRLYTLSAPAREPRISQVVSQSGRRPSTRSAPRLSRDGRLDAVIALALYGPIILEEIPIIKTTLLVCVAAGSRSTWEAPAGRTRLLAGRGPLGSAGSRGAVALPFLPSCVGPILADGLPPPVVAAPLPRSRRRLAIILPLFAWNRAWAASAAHQRTRG